ncbi:MAG: hypothetical protein J6N52_13105 [Clostridia bacterium]|nr:hypothetical protein [Clostridia bacterium]
MWKRKGNTNEKSMQQEEFAGGQEAQMSDEEFERHIDDIMSGANKASGKEPFMVFQTEADYLRHMEQKLAEKTKENDGIGRKYELLVGYLKDFYGVQTDEEAIDIFEKQLNEEKNGEKQENRQNPAENTERDDKPSKSSVPQDDTPGQDAVTSMRNRLFGEEALIRRDDPDFNLRSLYNSDSEFREDVNSTGSVYYAYIRYKNRNKAQKLEAQPMQGPATPAPKKRSYNEVGAVPGSAMGRIKTSPAKLPDADFDEYIKKIMGEQ